MISGFTASATINQLQKKMDTIANNMANANTVGYKGRSVSFSDVLSSEYVNQPNESRLTPHGLRVGTGSRPAQTSLSTEQGVIRDTSRELDFALTEANLFFQIETDSGQRLTRDGTFYYSQAANGELQLVTKNGDRVLNEAGAAITLPANTASVEWQDGLLYARLANGEEQAVGTFAISQIERTQALQAVGENQFVYPLDDAVLTQLEGGQLKQGALEQSNIDIGHEMAELMATQRQMQFQAKAFTFSDDMAGLVNSIRR